MRQKRTINFYRYTSNEEERAIITQYNGSFRVLDENNNEILFRELNNAIKHLINRNFLIENIFKLHEE